MANEDKTIETIPVGPLGLIPLKSCEELGKKVDSYLVRWRKSRRSEYKSTPAFAEYEKDTYILQSRISRFGTGEGKGQINVSVRGDDLFLMVDVCNNSLTYSLRGMMNHMSPDDHFADLKRIISAAAGKARRVTVIMPYLYESRRETRKGRESLDCSMALHELVDMGVENIITFDAHDPRVQNAIPLKGFENISPIYQFVKSILAAEPDLIVDSDHMMVISPDAHGMGRAIYFANMFGVDLGMFYQRRDYTRMVGSRNPVVAVEFLGSDVSGKDVMIVDDMISSGETMQDVARELKNRGAKRVFCCATFGHFTNGLQRFDRYYENGIIDRIFTTNLIYQPPELLSRPYYCSVDMSKYIALIIDNLNHDTSINDLLEPSKRIQRALAAHKEARQAREAEQAGSGEAGPEDQD